MAILRRVQKSQYTVIDQSIFKDKTLSNKALGMLCRMLSLPDEWEFSVEGLSKLSSDGISAVRSALSELEKAGYFRRQQIRNGNKIAGVEYIISETKMCENLISENLISEKLISENRPQSNTNKSNTNSSISKKICAEFEKLWELYPRKQGKQNAYKAYGKARKEGVTYEEVEQGIKAYAEYVKGKDAQYIKMGSSFFNQRSWQDDWSVNGSNRTFGNDYSGYQDDFGEEPDGWEKIFG